MSTSSISYEISPQEAARIQALKAACKFETDAQVFNHALSLLQWAFAERRAGRTIGAVDERAGIYAEYLSPELEAVAPRKS